MGALSHAVIHSLDVTIALGRPAVAPADAVVAVLDHLVAADGAFFGIDLTGVRGWRPPTRTGSGARARPSARTAARWSPSWAVARLPDGRTLRRALTLSGSCAPAS